MGQETRPYPLNGDNVPTFEVFDRATGKTLVVDERTYDETLHSKTKVAASKSAKEKDKDE